MLFYGFPVRGLTSPAVGVGVSPAYIRAVELASRIALSRNHSTIKLADPFGAGLGIMAFLIVVYLGYNNGGYGVAERSEVAIVAAWSLFVAAAVGAWSTRWTAPARLSIGLMTLFLGWTALSLLWTPSPERTVAEVSRVAGFLAVFALAVGLITQKRVRPVLYGIAAGLAAICAVAVLSWLLPGNFPERVVGDFLPSTSTRLSFPVNYTTGLGAVAALTVVLLLATTVAARGVLVGGIACACVPVAALALWLSESALSVPALVGGCVALLALTTHRMRLVASLLLSLAGSALVCAGVAQRSALDEGLLNAAGEQQGKEVLALLIVVCAGIGFLFAGGRILQMRRRPDANSMPHLPSWARRASLVIGAVVAVGAGVWLAAGGAADSWDRFKAPPVEAAESTRLDRLLDYSGNGRYEIWASAVDAGASSPMTGIGAGTFEYWWAESGRVAAFVRDAHSLFLESYAELGLIGIAIVIAMVLSIIGGGVLQIHKVTAAQRPAMAGVVAGAVVFAISAGLDWMWELSVLPVTFFVLAAAALQGSKDPRQTSPAGLRTGPAGYALRAGAVLLALVTLYLSASVLAGTSSIESSRAAVQDGDLEQALTEARKAEAAQPYAASPLVQQALVHEARGDLKLAFSAIRLASNKDPADWRTWVIRSRLEARTGLAAASVRSYRKAREMNPTSPLFSGEPQ